MQHLLLLPERVEEFWPGIESLIPEGLHATTRNALQIKEALLNKVLAGILIVDGEYLRGFITIKFREEDTGLYLDVVTIAGTKMHLWWKETMEVLEKLARGHNVDFIEFVTKRRASRFIEQDLGFKPIAIMYRKALK